MATTKSESTPKGEKLTLEAPTDQFGNKREHDKEKYPEGSPAREGSTTPPSGQGGATPHDGVSYQDQFAPNPPPSESAAAKGEENDKIARGEADYVTIAQEAAGQTPKATTTETTTTKETK